MQPDQKLLHYRLTETLGEGGMGVVWAMELVPGEDLSQRGPDRRADSSSAAQEADTTRSSRPSRYYSWPELMRRVFEVDVLQCRCASSPRSIRRRSPGRF